MGLLPNRLIEAAERGVNALVRLADAAEVIACELRTANCNNGLEWEAGSRMDRFYDRVIVGKAGPR